VTAFSVLVVAAGAARTEDASAGQAPAAASALGGALAGGNRGPDGLPVSPATARPRAVAARPAHAYYVNCSTGRDTGSGAATQPWRSLTPVDNTVFPEDSGVYLARGCIWNAMLKISGVPDTDKGVLITAYGSGSRPMISGAGRSDPSAVALLSDHMELTGVAVTGAAQYGIQMFGAHDVVQDVQVSDSGTGVRAKGAGDVIDNVQVRDLHMIVNIPTPETNYGAVGFDVEAADVEGADSSCTRCRAPSDNYGFDGGFAEIWDHGDDLYLHGNLASDTEGFIEIGGLGPGISARHVRIEGNTMTDVHDGAIFVHDNDDFAIPTADILMSGNRITNHAPSSLPLLGGYLGSLDLVDNTVLADQPIALSAPERHTGNTFSVPGASSVGFPLMPSETLEPLSATR